MKKFIVLVLVLGLTGVASVNADTFYGMGGDWDTNTNWWHTDGVGWYQNRPPSLSDDVYMSGNAPSSSWPAQLVQSDTLISEAGNLYMSMWDGFAGGAIEIGATLNANNLFYGNWWATATDVPTTESLIWLKNADADFNLGLLQVLQLNPSAPVNRITIDDGAMDLGSLTLNATNVTFELNNGYLGIYDDNYSGLTGSNLDIDMIDGRLVLHDSAMADVLANGNMTVGGVVVTAGNLNTLLNTEVVGTDLTQYTLIPEPATMLLLGIGGLALIRRRKA